MAPNVYSTDYLLSQIARICLEARPADPATVTQREFDETRVSLGVTCPRAARLVARFNKPWSELVATIHAPGAFQSLRRGEQGSKDQVQFDEETAVAAVRNAAIALDVETLKPDEYTAYRSRLLASARGLNRKRLETRWPVTALIQQIGWENTLERAGLKRTDADTHEAVDNPDAIGLYLECRGFAPPLRVAIDFLRSQGVAAKRRSMHTDVALETLRERRQGGDRGKWTPDRVLQEHERPEVPDACLELEKEKLAPYKPAAKVMPHGWWMNEQRMIEGLKTAISKLESGESLTQVTLRRLAKENRGRIPSPSTVTEYAKRNGTSLPELRERAREELELQVARQ